MDEELNELMRARKRELTQAAEAASVATAQSEGLASKATISEPAAINNGIIKKPDGWLLVDPPLPEGFNNRDNAQRSALEVVKWWDKPYARTTADGKFDVYCLDGGAWDRATWYGEANSYEEAMQLAAQKLVECQLYRSRPIVTKLGPPVEISRLPQHPFDNYLVLENFQTRREAVEWLKEHFPEAQ